jgi:3-deoxy-D-manno-octulosonic-acid transferase
MRYVYDFGLMLYRLAVWLTAIVNDRAQDFIAQRKKALLKLETTFKRPDGKLIWVHVASLGEFEQAKPLITAIKSENQSIKVIVTFFSPSGYSQAIKNTNLDFVYYLPFDSSQNGKKFLTLVKPDLALFIKYDLWYHYLCALEKSQVPTYLVAGIFRKDQFYFKPYGRFFKKALKAFHHFFVQDMKSQQLLKELGFNNTLVLGDTRFDRVNEISKGSPELGNIKAFKSDKACTVAGSVWPSDMQYLKPLIDKYRNEVCFIIVPHVIDEEVRRGFGITDPCFYSSHDFSKNHVSNVLIIDEIGLLSRIYAYADLALVGGAFRGAVHNVLEPAAFGLPILIGENKSNEKFNEVIQLQQLGGLETYSSFNELDQKITRLLSDEGLRKEVGGISRKFVADGAGATEKMMNHIKHWL